MADSASKSSPPSSSLSTESLESIEAECIICYEVPKTYGVIDCCSHTFCYNCIRQWETRQEASDVAQGPLTLLTEDHDRKEALEAYKEMLSNTPCAELLKSPRNRKYCPRGIDCLYSHTIPLNRNKSITHTYTFTHTYHSHLLLESRIRSELSAKRILEALFTFAYEFDPTEIDRMTYARALSQEFDRIHSTLSREETEDPEIWRIVEEVQDVAARYGMGGMVEHRMSQLGRDPRLSMNGSGNEAEWTTDEEDSEEEEEQEEYEWDDDPLTDESNQISMRRSFNDSTNSLPALEDIDRDEDEPPFPRSNITLPTSAINYGEPAEPLRVEDLDPEFVDQLVHSYRRAFDLESSSYDEDNDDSESESPESEEASEEENEEEGSEGESDGESDSEDLETTRAIIEELANPLRRPRHPRARPSQSATVDDWSLRDSASTPRTPFRPLSQSSSPYFASLFYGGLVESDYSGSRISRSFRSGDGQVSSVLMGGFGNLVRRLRNSPPQVRPAGDSTEGYSQHEESENRHPATAQSSEEEEDSASEGSDSEGTEDETLRDDSDGLDHDQHRFEVVGDPEELERGVISQTTSLWHFLAVIVEFRTNKDVEDDTPLKDLIRQVFSCPSRRNPEWPIHHPNGEFWDLLDLAADRVTDEFWEFTRDPRGFGRGRGEVAGESDGEDDERMNEEELLEHARQLEQFAEREGIEVGLFWNPVLEAEHERLLKEWEEKKERGRGERRKQEEGRENGGEGGTQNFRDLVEGLD
ncbi:hypothetical protein JCM5350_005130 [Sporobolomyces pararoseus]